MALKNVLLFTSREEFRDWLESNSTIEDECYLHLKRGEPKDDGCFYYLDAVEEALCFGWIDSTYINIKGISFQRFSPRRKDSNWTELNKERVRRLEKLGLMTDEGRKVLPNMSYRSFKPDKEIINKLKEARVYSKFIKFPELYQRVRMNNLMFYKNHIPHLYENSLIHLIKETKEGKMYGEWNDYGRLLSY